MQKNILLSEIEFQGTKYPVKIIETESFSGCKKLEKVVIPQNYKEIRNYAFAGCEKLTSVVLPEGIELCNGVFRDCTKLDNVKLPTDLTYIPAYAFCGCVSLKNIIFPKKIIIGCDAFEECTSLTSLYFPDGLFEIEEAAFARCTNLKEISFGRFCYFDEDSEQLDEFEQSPYHSDVFAMCPNLNSITFRNEDAFEWFNCFDIENEKNAIFYVPKGKKKKIDDLVIENCTNFLKELRFEGKIEEF